MIDGAEHHQALRLSEAVDRYARVVKMLPEYGEAWRLLGVVALQSGDYQAARNLLGRAIRLDANDAAAYGALGGVSEAEGRLDAAQAAYAAACAIEETQPAAVVGLTRVTLALGRPTAAIRIAEGAISRGSTDAGLLRLLGAARLELRDYAGARDALVASVRIRPDADAHANLGAAYVQLHEIDAAITACNDALTLKPSHAGAANNLGIARKAQGAFAAALGAFERAVALGSEDAHVNLGTTRLLLDDFQNGWPEYGWSSAERRANPLFTSLPMWDGGPAPGQRLLIWPEQGVGDTIQMARFLPRAHQLVGSVALRCSTDTVDLLRSAQGVDALIDTAEPPSAHDFDVWLPTIRLPVVFDVAQHAIPTARYLRADPQRIAKFRAKLQAPDRLRVGLVWSGNPQFRWNTLRSCTLAQLQPLQDIPGVAWFALQQGQARAQQTQSSMQLLPINDDVSDFADTAAIIEQLDLVITVDTSVAHVAGALGRPAWVLLSNRPDWRWQLAGETSLWYPSLRIFRQGDDGEWAPVMAVVAAALRELTAVPRAKAAG